MRGRRRDDRTPPDVDFVGDVTPAEAPDEDVLPAAPHRWSFRRRVVAAVLVLAVVAALVVARLATRSTPTAAPQPSTSASSAASTSVSGPATVDPSVPPLVALSRAEFVATQEQCPRLAPTCVATGEIPTAVVTGVHDEFPAVGSVLSVSAVAYRTTSGPTLAYRRLSAHSADVLLSVEIRPARDGEDADVERVVLAGRVVTYAQRPVGDGLLVRVSATALHGLPIDAVPVLRLAADPNVLAVG